MDRFPLTIIGDISVDLVMGPVSHWPAVGTETIMDRSELRAGGSGGNTAFALRSLGASCRLVARHGDDPLGKWLAAQFTGINTALAPIPDTATSLSVGVIDTSGERTFFTTRGHLEQCEWQHLRGHVDSAPPSRAIAILTGTFLLPRVREVYKTALEQLRSYGYTIAIDTGWPSGGWTPELREQAMQWLERCDHILLNEAEITALAQDGNLKSAMRKLSDALPAHTTLVAKIGARGAMALRDGLFYSHGAAAATVFDTIGAGDAFNAGYLEAHLRSDDVTEALRAGCSTATAIISHFPRQHIRPPEFRL